MVCRLSTWKGDLNELWSRTVWSGQNICCFILDELLHTLQKSTHTFTHWSKESGVCHSRRLNNRLLISYFVWMCHVRLSDPVSGSAGPVFAYIARVLNHQRSSNSNQTKHHVAWNVGFYVYKWGWNCSWGTNWAFRIKCVSLNRRKGWGL